MRIIRTLSVLLFYALTHTAYASCTSTTNGTAQTLTYLTQSEFQDGQAAGSITPACVRDLIQSTFGAASGIVNLKNLGLPTGGDDTTAINSAIQTAKTNGESVYAPAGDYKFAGQILVDSVRLYGDGPDATIFEATVATGTNPSNNINLINTGPALENIQVKSDWTGSRQSNGGSIAVYVDGSDYTTTHFMVRNVRVNGSASAGILAQGGAAALSAYDGIIEDNYIYNTLADGVHVCCGGSFVTVAHNFVSASGNDCFPTVNYSGDTYNTHDITWIGNRCTGSLARGLVVEGGSGITYTGNIVASPNSSSVGFCITAASDSGLKPTSNVTFSGNVLDGCGSLTNYGEPVAVYGTGASNIVSNVMISNNIIQNSLYDCVNAGRGAGSASYTLNVTFTGNYCGGPGNVAAFEGITGNEVTNYTITNNTVYNQALNCINVSNTNAGYLVVSGNTCDKINAHAGTGYLLNAASTGFSGLTITNNILRDDGTTPTGLLLVTGNTYVHISGNVGDVHTSTISGITHGWVFDEYNNTATYGGTTLTLP